MNFMARDKGKALLLSAFIWLSLPSDGWSDTGQTLQQVQLLSVQNALIERMTGAACFISAFSQPEHQRDVLSQSKQAYERNLITEQAVISAIDSLDELDHSFKVKQTAWQQIKFGIDLLLQTSQNPGIDVDLISGFSPLAVGANEIILQTLLEKADVPTIAAETLRQSARLSVLSQRSVQEFCSIVMAPIANQARNKLAHTLQAMDQVIEDLVMGNEAFSISAPPRPDLAEALNQLQALWQPARQLLQRASEGAHLRSSDFKAISQMSESFLKHSLNLTEQYIAHFQEQGTPPPTEPQFSPGS